ncbi:AMP-binding protein [Xanthobacter pseudotagetidis]|uniref:AMP-binding protein n=1 Tax=Xanthobacter pseudotagetidis TaxID=3119911 RepID=UPI00372663E0
MGACIARPDRMDEDWTVPGILRKSVLDYGDRPSLQIVNGIQETYAQTWDSVIRLARRLAGHGIGRQDRVILMLGNTHLSVHAWLAVNLLGAVDVNVNTGFKGGSLIHAINLSQAPTLLVTSDLLPAVLNVAGEVGHLASIVVLDQAEGPDMTAGPRIPIVSAQDLDEGSIAQALEEPVKPWETASVIFTSGTSGAPKGAIMPHGQVALLAKLAASKMGMTREDVFFSFYPMYHMAGKFMSVLAALSVGAKLVMDSGFKPEEWLDRIRSHGATMTAAHGPMLEMVYALPPSPKDRDHRLRLIRTAPFPKRIAGDFERRFGVRGMEVWGMTEVGVVCWADMREPLRAGSCGRPDTDWYEFAVLDPATDMPLPPKSPGEFAVRPRLPWTIMQGYLGMPERTVECWRNLWFHTGDFGYVDDDGNVYFLDRAKDRIRRRAENISAGDIEAAALLHPLIVEAAAVGVPSGYEGDDDILLHVVMRPGSILDPAEVLAFLLQRLPHFMVPRYLNQLPTLPRTVTGKLQHALLPRAVDDADVWDRKRANIALRSLRT